MRTDKLAVGLSAALFTVVLSAAPVNAGAGPKSHGPKVTSTTTKGSAKATPTTAKSHAPKRPSAKAGGTKKTTAGSTKTVGKNKTTATTTTTSPTSTSTTTSSTTTTTPTTTWTPNNPVAQKLSTKANLIQKANGVLPPNTDLNLATAGFKTFGQFVAAVNVAQNLKIPFADLKLAMTGIPLSGTPTTGGTTGPVTTLSLGQAIQKLRPEVNSTLEAEHAQTQASLETGEKVTTTASTTSTKGRKSK